MMRGSMVRLLLQLTGRCADLGAPGTSEACRRLFGSSGQPVELLRAADGLGVNGDVDQGGAAVGDGLAHGGAHLVRRARVVTIAAERFNHPLVVRVGGERRRRYGLAGFDSRIAPID